MSAIYIYDRRTQLQEPVAVVYDKKNVELIVCALFGHFPEFIFESIVRLHPYDKHPYTSMGSQKSSKSR